MYFLKKRLQIPQNVPLRTPEKLVKEKSLLLIVRWNHVNDMREKNEKHQMVKEKREENFFFSASLRKITKDNSFL